jgi:ribosomal protein S21|tara:strand:- start:4103 stop:4348 length:246 start_codon:yes stop_codon:yes gene_type:complete
MADNVQITPRFKGEPFDKMLRRFKNKVERAGIIKDVRKKVEYLKPSEIKNRKNQELKRTKLNNKRKQKQADEKRKVQSKWR